MVFTTVAVYTQTQAIGGVINSYEAVSQIIPCDSTVRMRTPTQFTPGDLVLMIQMKGAKIQTAEDSTYGTILDMNGAGCAEFLTVGFVQGNLITFTTTWVHPYDAGGSIQLVGVPRYVNAITTSPVIPRRWNGSIGGVVALAVDQELIIESDIDVSGRGFRGGKPSVPRGICDVTSWSTGYIFGLGGEKGEGIATMPTPEALGGRGPQGTGGGGGNGNNGGGAGGSNGGRGGFGGDPTKWCAVRTKLGGWPGPAVDSLFLKQRVFLGGGGGGGHQNDVQATRGEDGGGIIVVKANSIRSTGGKMIANGNNVIDTSAWRNNRPLEPGDGAGGGGAGGTIVLDVLSVVGTLAVEARGGNGGLIGARYDRNGPGGGGGGGAVITTRVHPGIFANVGYGVPGIHISPENGGYLDPDGATEGEEGRVISDFVWKTPQRIKLTASGSGKICPGDSITLSASQGFMLYRWSNGATGPSVVVRTTEVLSVTAIDSSGCSQTVSGLTVRLDPTLITTPLIVDLGGVDFMQTYQVPVPIKSEDDDEILVTGITLAPGFRLVDPVVFPFRIAPMSTVSVVIEFYALEPREYREIMTVAVASPCPIERTIELRAKVNPVRLHFFMPDTNGRTGTESFALPVYMDLSPDTVLLRNIHLRIRVRMSSLVFAPTRVDKGVIVEDIIDKIRNTRTLTIDLDSIDISGGTSVLTRVLGTVLLSNIDLSVLDILDLEWLRIYRTPIITIDDGSLAIDPACFDEGRNVRIMPRSMLAVGPNPASDNLTMSSTLGAPGEYTFVVVDLQGREVLRHTELHPEGAASRPITLKIPTTMWDQGVYQIRFVAPLETHVAPLLIQR